MAHNGILFLDELPEFQRSVLKVLRQPMEEGTFTIARARSMVDHPARFMLVAAMNPCPCGYQSHPGRNCSCPEKAIECYMSKVSGPLMDRIDMHLEVCFLWKRANCRTRRLQSHQRHYVSLSWRRDGDSVTD